MAQIKISQLEELTSVSDNDVFASVDTANSKTKKTKASTLKKYVKENLNYSEVAGKPSINGTELLGDKSLQDLGIQPAGDYALNSALKSYSLVTETGNKISLTINSSTYVMTLQLKDKNGNVLSTGTIDLPLETMVVGASYNADTQEIELTLKNGSKVSFSVADLVKGLVNEDDLNDTLQDYALKTSIPTKLSQLTEDSTHRLVTDTEKATWNNKVDKVDGKGLSTNDFTNELKSKLDGIEDNAQVNKIEKISIDGIEQEINEKEVNIKSYDINKYFYNALTYNELKGNDLTFEDSIEFPLGKLDMDGKSEQFTTTGKNLLNLDFTTNPTTVGGANFAYENNKFTIKGTPTNSYSIFRLKNLISIVDGESYTFSANVNGTNPNMQIALKAYNDEAQVIFSIIINSNNLYKATSNISLNSQEIDYFNFIIESLIKGEEYDLSAEIQLEKSTEATDIEPYTGGQPSPSPDFQQKINSIEGDLEYVGYGSKNLLNATRNEYTSNGITLSADTSNVYINGTSTINTRLHTNAFKIPKGTYTISLELINGSITSTSSQTVALFYLFKDYTANQITNYIGLSDTKKQSYITFTLEEDTNVNLSIFARTSETFTNAVIQYQITKGESADYDFVPYKGRTLTIPTNGQVFRKVEDVADKLIIDMKTGDYYKEKNIEEYEYNGSSDSNIGRTGLVASTIGEDLIAGVFIINSTIPNSINKPISNKFSTKVLGSESDNENKNNVRFFEGIAHHSISNRQFVISIKKSRLNTADLDGFIQYFSNNPIKIQCALETPTLEKIGTLTKEQLDMLVTFKGYNNVMINTNLGQADIDIEYVLDMKKYIDNKIAEISAQMI